MFGKLKDKLKKWTESLGKKEEGPVVVETPVEETPEELSKKPEPPKEVIVEKAIEEPEPETPKEESPKNQPQEIPEKKEVIKEKKVLAGETPKEETPEEKKEEPESESQKEVIAEPSKEPPAQETKPGEPAKESPPKEEERKRGFFSKISQGVAGKVTLTREDLEEPLEELSFTLLENNVAMDVAEKMGGKLMERLEGRQIGKREREERIKQTLKEVIEEVLLEGEELTTEIKAAEKPYIMVICGINGTGKTTTIAKIAHRCKKEGLSVAMAAGDTFRAASIEQIKEHGERLNVPVIAQEYQSDPAAVGFDAIAYAKKNKIDVVIIDTAGRMHTAKNLLQELGKIVRVCKPNKTIFVGEAITGNDILEQVNHFAEVVNIDGVILSKADIDEKGGTILSVGYVTKKPILYLGTGQEYDKLEPFKKEVFIKSLGLD